MTEKAKRLFFCSIVGYFVSSVTVFFIPLSNGFDDVHQKVGTLIGIFFWFGILFGTISFWLTWAIVKEKTGYEVIKTKYKPAYITFFSRPIAIFSDSIFVITVVFSVIGNSVFKFNDGIQLLLMFLVLFTFFIHFIFNGRVYRYLFLNS